MLLLPAAILLGGALVPACSCVAKPEINFEVARLKGFEFNLSSGPMLRVETTVRVKNRMSSDLTIRRVTANVTLAGQPMAPVTVDVNRVFPGGEDKRVTFDVMVPGQTALAILKATIGHADLPYKVTGVADVSAMGVDSKNEPLDEQGTIPRGKLLDAVKGMFPGVSIN